MLKAPLSAWIFIVALLLVGLISLGTLGWQVGKAARVNPAEVMKSENKPGFAISIAGPTARINEHKKHDIVDDLKKTAFALSEVIYGFAPKKS